MTTTRLILVLAAVAVLGAVTPVAAVGLGTPGPVTSQPADGPDDGSNVSVTPGSQLATVLAATEVTTRSEIEATRFELELERDRESDRAEVIAERADTLEDRAADIREDYETATAAYEAGELSSEAYARELATLNARSEQVLAEVRTLRTHAQNVSALELRAAGMNHSALRAATDDLDPLTGVGPSAILQRFLGQSTGAVEIRTDTGLRVEVEGEEDERSLEVSRPRDDDPAMTVGQDSALQTARDVLPPGTWTLESASVQSDSGYYRFEFDLRTSNRAGEATVRVDGSSGEVFRLEVETERPESDERDDDEHDEDRTDDDHDDDEQELTLLLVGGTPTPNGTITVRAVADGEAVSNVTLHIDDRAVATTDSNGEATVRLPNAAEVEVTAGDDGELEFEFDEDAYEDAEVYRSLDVDATLRGEEVTAQVTFDGSPVEDAIVYVNDRRLGATGADGTVSFALDPNETDELELELHKGAFEAEFEYDVRHGELVLTEAAHERENDDGHEDEREGDHEREDERESDEVDDDADEDGDEMEEDSDEDDDDEDRDDDEDDDH